MCENGAYRAYETAEQRSGRFRSVRSAEGSIGERAVRFADHWLYSIVKKEVFPMALSIPNESSPRGPGAPPCPACNSEGGFVFHSLKGLPVHSVMNTTSFRQARDLPVGDIALSFCNQCGFVSNSTFDEKKVSYSTDNYEATQACSPTFRMFAERQARRLIDRHGLSGKRVLEIGCGNGEFLELICRLGDNEGIGFDPSYNKKNSPVKSDRKISFVKDYFTEKHTGHGADFVMCRMTLEHIHKTGRFVRMVRSTLGAKSDTTVFFQVPDATRILRDCAFEDVYFEHCSYFSPGSLARLFRRAGFGIIGLEGGYDGQYVMIEARPGVADDPSCGAPESDLISLRAYVRNFADRYRRKAASWHACLRRWRAAQRRVVLWGAGSKAVSFLTSLGIPPAFIPYAVDINPHRHGSYIAGTGQRVVGPQYMREYRPSTVIVMNEVYREEVETMLRDLGLRPQLVTMESGGAL
ncbi:MAG: methyltransferase domain-containing protein [Chitinivibrionales bacterium]|nr:methyltransferase domain-containing protein [Chitinivibrionales bacterium]MBD3355592.1 methyltransferase domain-containing protein [Chitinivibrionales bacterium]